MMAVAWRRHVTGSGRDVAMEEKMMRVHGRMAVYVGVRGMD